MFILEKILLFISKPFCSLDSNFSSFNAGIFSNDFFFFIFECFFIFSIIFVLIFFVILSNQKVNGYYLNVSNCFLKFLPFIILVLIYLLNNGVEIPYYLFNGFYFNDLTSIYFKNILLFFFLIFIFSVQDYAIRYKRYDFEFLVVLFLSFFSSVLIINSNDLLSLFFVIELQSLTFYILVASKQTSSFSTEAGLKYFVLGCFSSGVILFGISLIYGFTGMLSYNDLLLYSSVSFNLSDYSYFFSFTGFLTGLLFLTIGLLFKCGSVPFHMWLPDVYEGSPLIITAYLSTLPKLALFYIFFKLYYSIFSSIFSFFHSIFVLSAILSIILGSIAAIYQVKIKRMLTYSMITNTGYLILGLSLGDVSGIFVTFFYLVSYVFIMLGIFFIFLSLRDRTKGFLIKKISSVINLFEINSFLALSLFILLFSIAGIPPLLGFYNKLFLFLFALKLGMYWVVIIFVVFSVVTVFYYIRLVKLAYFNRSLSWVFFEEISFSNALIISVIVILNCLFFINPNLLFKLVYNLSFYIVI